MAILKRYSGHIHDGVDAASVDHDDLLNKGTLSHSSLESAISGKSSTDHDSTHITSGSDEIDGDKLDIDWNPTNYTPDIVTNYADSVDNLTAHLKGIDDKLASEITQDVVGAMLSSNVETGVSLTYDDTNAKIDAYVTPYDVVGGRLDLVSATSIKRGFQNSNHIRLFNPTSEQWELVQVTTEPTIANTALDLNGTALAVDKIYDVFAEYSSATAFTLVVSRWQTVTAGSSARTAAWAGNTAYNIGDRVSTGSPTHYYVCIAAHTSHATSFSNDTAKWVDNGVAADVGSNSDFYGLYRHDGVLVSDSSTTGRKRRWLGIIYTYNNSSTVNFKDSAKSRLISNFYNRKKSYLSYSANAAGATYTSAGYWTNWSGPGVIAVLSCSTSPYAISFAGTLVNSSDGQRGLTQLYLNGSEVSSVFNNSGNSVSTQNGYTPYMVNLYGLNSLDMHRANADGGSSAITQWGCSITATLES